MFTMKYLIFVAFLLATANAFPFNVYKRDEHLVRLHKRATTFTPCAKGSPVPLNITTDADPTIGKTFTATIMFVTDKDYPKMSLTTTFTEDDGKAIDGGVTTADLCTDIAGFCPVAKGQQVTLTAKTAVPDAAKLPYDIEFNVNDGTNTIGCSTAKITADGTPAAGAPGAAPGAAPGGPAPGGPPPGGPPPAPAGGGKAGKAAPGPAPGPAKAGGGGGGNGGGGGGGPPPPGGPPPATPADGGAPPATPADGGAPPADGGAPPADGGAPPADGGAPPADGGAPPTGAGGGN